MFFSLKKFYRKKLVCFLHKNNLIKKIPYRISVNMYSFHLEKNVPGDSDMKHLTHLKRKENTCTGTYLFHLKEKMFRR